MYAIKGSIFVDLKINNVIFPLDITAFDYILLNSGVLLGLPTLTIELLDPLNLFQSSIALADSIPVEFSYGLDPNNLTKTLWTLFHSEILPTSGKTKKYRLSCILNSAFLILPLYHNYNDTTSSIINSIMPSVNLLPDLETTNDKNMWYPSGMKAYKFVARLVRHSFVDSTSMMMGASTFSGHFRYRNILKKPNPKTTPVFSLSTGKDVTYIVTKAEGRSMGGFNNFYMGYASTFHEWQLDGSLKKYNQVSQKKLSTNLNMDSTSHVAAAQGRLEFIPLDCGNTYTNYHQARYQNDRGLALLNSGHYLTIMQQSGVNLLDTIHFQNLTDNSLTASVVDHINSGFYVVTGKTLFMNPTNYFEKFSIIRQGLNNIPSNQINQVS